MQIILKIYFPVIKMEEMEFVISIGNLYQHLKNRTERVSSNLDRSAMSIVIGGKK